MEVDLNGKKLMIATPTYDGKIPVEWMSAYNNTVNLANKYGIAIELQFHMGSSLIPKARDEIISYYINSSDSDYILCIDADIIWNPEDVLHMLSKIDKYKVIAGMYCTKQEEPKFLTDLMTVNKQVISSEGLLRSLGVPAGFLMIKREVITGMMEAYPELEYQSKDKKIHALFTPTISNGVYLGEDIAFCKRLIAKGYRLWIDPEIELIHMGTKRYDFSYKEYLKTKEDTDKIVAEGTAA